MPIILAIETSSEMASCALLLSTGPASAPGAPALLWRESNGVRTHSQAILPMVQELLGEAGLALRDCDAIAFGAGPGSFTGVRTACGIAQGLAYGAGLPVIPLITLDAMALACHAAVGATEVLAMLDARMGEVYWGQYRYIDGAWSTVSAPALCAPEAVAPQPVEGLVACGNALTAYLEALAPYADSTGGTLSAIMPHARELAQQALGAFARGETVDAASAQPLYLRNKIAYTSAERQVINAAKAAA